MTTEHERKRAEEALQASQKLNEDVLDSLSAHISVLDKDGTITLVNKSWRQFALENGADWTLKGVGVGSNYLEICRTAQGVNSDEAEAIYYGLRQILSGESKFFTLEYPCHSPTIQRWFLLTASPLKHGSGAVVSHQNITERRRAGEALRASEARFRFLDTLNKATQTAINPASIMEITTQLLGEHLDVSICAYADMESDEDEFTIRHDWTAADVPSITGVYSLNAFGSHASDLLRSGQMFITRDAVKDIGDEQAAPFLAIGIQATICFPLVKAGRLCALMAVHSALPREWTIEDAALVGEVTERSWAHIERVRSEEALRQSEERFRSLVAASAHVVWITDRDGAIPYPQASWGNFTGQSYAEYSGWGWLNAIHPDDQRRVSNHWEHCLAERSLYEIEYRLRRHDGVYRDTFARGVPMLDAAGVVREWIGQNTDITERKQAEADTQLLADLAERIRLADDANQLLAEVAEMTGNHLQVSRCYFVEVFELEDRWTIQRDYHSTLPSIAGTYYLSDYDSGVLSELRAGRLYVSEDLQIDPRTAPIYETHYKPFGVRASIAVPFHRKKQWVLNLMVNSDTPRTWQAREISLLGTVAERIWLAVEKLRLDSALRDSEERLRTAGAAADLGTWRIDLRTNLYTHDANLNRLLGLGTVESTQSATEFMMSIHVEDRARVKAEIERVIREGGQYQVECRVVRADGAVRWLLNQGAVLCDRDGNPEFIAGAAVDITTGKQMEEALREADRRKDEFLAMLAHELRNPLTPIRNAAQILKLVGPSDANQQWAREVIERQTQHLTRLVDDLLDVSRITQGKVTLQYEPIEMSAIIHRAVETNRPLIDARKHKLTVKLPYEPVYVEGDLTRLVQVADNLLNNATKYTDEGGHIKLEVAVEGKEAVIRVRDNGMGLSADLLPHVFGLFTQAARSLDRSQGGLGIGLTLVRQLVEMHGGRVEARSDGFGHGSEFIVRLPSATVKAIAEKTESDPVQVAPHKLRVLVVEDNVDSAEMMAFVLNLSGHETQIAYDGLSALDAARDFSPQVVLCDIGLPGMNGYEVAERLRSQSEFKHTRLIALTGYGQEEDRRRAHDAGFDYHLTKPVEPDVLTALLDSL